MRKMIVREYLESLTESEEFDFIFPMLLEVMDFQILSNPIQSKGLNQYGKDIVAIGNDISDGIEKRIYFELKGGNDRHITENNYSKKDGIRESIIEAKDKPYNDNSIPNFSRYPIKIILAHNGEIKSNIQETFDGFINREFPSSSAKGKVITKILKKIGINKKSKKASYEFERWDISKLTHLFDEYFFSEYLLTNEDQVNKFKKVLVLLNNPQSDFKDFFEFVDILVNNLDQENSSNQFNRRIRKLFESLRLTAFIIFHYSKEANNLESAKRLLPYLVLQLWSWIIKNDKTNDKQYTTHFNKIFQVYLNLLEEYFDKLIKIAELENGLMFDNAGRYEQIGYPIRSLEFISYYIFYYNCLCDENIYTTNNDSIESFRNCLLKIIANNSCDRPLLDNHSIPIYLIFNELLKIDTNEAKKYLERVFDNIKKAYYGSNRLPEGGNNLEVVIRYITTYKKSVYYKDATSLLFGMLSELFALLNMENEYHELNELIKNADIDIATYVPFEDNNVSSYLPEINEPLETRLFKNSIDDEGYQSSIFIEDSISEFYRKTKSKNEFKYDYQTDRIGYYPLRLLAHIFYKTPIFPNEWRDEL